MKKIFIISGEPSGDQLSSQIIRNLIEIYGEEADIRGIGGDLSAKEGLVSIFPQSDLAVMGIVEVLKKLNKIKKRLHQTINYINDWQPDLLITIDAQDFSVRVAKNIHSKNTKKIHVVAPTVWAWRPSRAKKYAKIFDHLFCLFPFEEKFFVKEGLATSFIGHPLAKKYLSKTRERNSSERNSSLVYKKIVFLPGSRKQEIDTFLPILKNVAKQLSKKYSNLSFLIPTLPFYIAQVENVFSNSGLNYSVVDNSDLDSKISESDFAFAASGTITYELCLLRVPHIVLCRVSWLSYIIGKLLVKIPVYSLGNIFHYLLKEQKEHYPFKELVQINCNARNIANEFSEIVKSQDAIKKQLDAFDYICKNSLPNSSSRPARKLVETLNQYL